MTSTAAILVAGAVLFAAQAVPRSGSMKAIVESYLVIHGRLAADTTTGIKEPARAIATQAAAMGERGAGVAKAAESVEKAADLEAARDAFAALTDAVLEARKAEGDVEGVKLAYCPMVNRSWLQKGEQIRNPYYGKSMLTCGEIKKEPATAKQ